MTYNRSSIHSALRACDLALPWSYDRLGCCSTDVQPQGNLMLKMSSIAGCRADVAKLGDCSLCLRRGGITWPRGRVVIGNTWCFGAHRNTRPQDQWTTMTTFALAGRFFSWATPGPRNTVWGPESDCRPKPRRNERISRKAIAVISCTGIHRHVQVAVLS